MPRTPALLLALALTALATPASAHVPARVRVAAPAEDARVVGRTLRVVLVGEGGTSAATFRLDLDGQPVDASGRLGGVFTTLSVRPQTQLVVTVGSVEPGTHTLTMTPENDADTNAPTVVRRFRVVADEGGSGALPLVLLGLVVAGAVGGAVLARGRAASRQET